MVLRAQLLGCLPFCSVGMSKTVRWNSPDGQAIQKEVLELNEQGFTLEKITAMVAAKFPKYDINQNKLQKRRRMALKALSEENEEEEESSATASLTFDFSDANPHAKLLSIIVELEKLGV